LSRLPIGRPIRQLALLAALAGVARAQGEKEPDPLAGTSKLPGVPVVLDELLAEMKQPPTGHAAREEALAELFRKAGATEPEIERMPLRGSLKSKLEAKRAAAIERLVKAGATDAEIEGARRNLEKRHAELGGNLRVVLPGRTERVIAFGAHLDAAEGSAGVIDNWAACVLLANLYETLRTTRLQHTLWFVGFAEEELGCLGSAAFGESIDKDMAGRIDLFVTLDCIGPSPLMAWWSGSSSGAVEVAADIAREAGLPLQVVDFAGKSSDSMSLRQRSLPVLSLFGTDAAHLALLHGPEDRFEAVDRRRIAEAYALLRHLVAGLDVHTQPLFWDYVKAKLRINDPASGRKPIRPMKLDFAAAPLPTPSEPPRPTADPPKPRDGSQP
jgi:hypothetical protein